MLCWVRGAQKTTVRCQCGLDHFDIDCVAAYGEADRKQLLNDIGIIRNCLKVNAAIENACRIQKLRSEYRSFKKRLDSHQAQTEIVFHLEQVKLLTSPFHLTNSLYEVPLDRSNLGYAVQ